jgi:hypothetical protein
VGGCAHATGAAPPQAIGKVSAATGPAAVVTSASGDVAQVNVGNPVCRHDPIEPATDGAAGIIFTAGTAFNLANDACMALNEFVRDPTHHAARRLGGRVAADADLAKRFHQARPVTHKTARFRKFACIVDGGNGVTCRQGSQLEPPGEEERVAAGHKRVGSLANSCGEQTGPTGNEQTEKDKEK